MANTIAIIPARGGSKGLPGKNLKKLNGIPLIDYSIRQALESDSSLIVITSDSQEILARAKAYPDPRLEAILRPSELAGDHAPVMGAVIHSLSGLTYDRVLLLSPTSPLRKLNDIERLAGLLDEGGFDMAISAWRDESWAWSWPSVGKELQISFSGGGGINRQDLIPRFRPAGTYLFTGPAIRENWMDNEHIGFIEIPKFRSLDIDSLDDWMIAESLVKHA